MACRVLLCKKLLEFLVLKAVNAPLSQTVTFHCDCDFSSLAQKETKEKKEKLIKADLT